MINEEISRHSLSLEARLAKASAKEVLKILKTHWTVRTNRRRAFRITFRPIAPK